MLEHASMLLKGIPPRPDAERDLEIKAQKESEMQLMYKEEIHKYQT